MKRLENLLTSSEESVKLLAALLAIACGSAQGAIAFGTAPWAIAATPRDCSR